MQPDGNDELNALGYTSSAPELADAIAPKVAVNQKDVANLSTLEQVALLLRNRKEYYDSNQALAFGQELTIENQLLVNKKVVWHIQEIESLIITAIKNVKEINNGSGQ